jgi:peptidoglycan-associated lipoprotein
MSPEGTTEEGAPQKSAHNSAPLELAHVLFMDIVSYSLLPMDYQSDVIQELQLIVRALPEFQTALAAGELVCLPTGDGMALAFFGDPTYPLRCAWQISLALKKNLQFELRMGIHTGPIYRVADINTNHNLAGGGINLAQRVMDCGDAGHILVSKSAAEVLAQLSTWKPTLHDLGEHEVKHGVKVHIFNVFTGEFGNPQTPSKVASLNQRAAVDVAANKSKGPASVGGAIKKSSKKSLLIAGALLIPVMIYLPFAHLDQNHFESLAKDQSRLQPATQTSDTKNVEESGPIKYLTAQPEQVRAGQSFQLKWSADGGVAVLLDQNKVNSSGTRIFQPSQTTTYTLEVQDELNNIIGRRYVTVRVLPPHPHSARNVTVAGDQFTLYDIYFDPGEVALDSDAFDALRNMRDTLGAILSRSAVVVEGFADEKSSAEGNLVVGDQRATAVRDYLVKLGLPPDKLRTISFGKQVPAPCHAPYEVCSQLNRRVVFSTSQ